MINFDLIFIKKFAQWGILLFWLFITGLFFSLNAYGDGNLTEMKTSDEISTELIHLLKSVGPLKIAGFDPATVKNVLNFIKAKKNNTYIYYPDNITGHSSAYYEFDIKQKFEDILKYAFNPDIPHFVMTPSSTRFSRWKEVNGYKGKLPRLWEYLNNLNTPVIIQGIEFIENTPDLSSGAYYSYDNYRTLILFQYKNRKVLISMSRQKDISSVGKKGYVLGKDENWDYIYSGKSGTNITGLGWVRSYMYDSYGISIYYELDDKTHMVRCGTFKWLKAGWSKINFVKNRHIYDGLIRFARSFTKIMENTGICDPDVMTETFFKIENMTEDELKEKILIYSKILKTRYADNKAFSVKWPLKIIDNKKFWSKMEKSRMESALMIEYIKCILGKTGKGEFEKLFRFVASK